MANVIHITADMVDARVNGAIWYKSMLVFQKNLLSHGSYETAVSFRHHLMVGVVRGFAKPDGWMLGQQEADRWIKRGPPVDTS